MSLISVIVPVYKVEPYLEACVDSILASTHKELEIILVDDGSPDNCPAICDEYARRDDRIRVIHQDNQGISGARNAGLRHATGDYVAFADSDDSVSPILYEQLVRAIEESGADMAACEHSSTLAAVCTSPEDACKPYMLFSGADELISVLTCEHSMRNRTWTNCFVWNKLYRREHIRFEFRKEYLIGEDIRFNWDYMQSCRTMVVVPSPLYFYRLNEGSITGTYKLQSKNPKMVIAGIRNAQAWSFIAQNSPVTSPILIDYLHNRAAYTAHGALWRIFSNGCEKEQRAYVREARNLVRQYWTIVIRDKESYSVFLRFMISLCANAYPLWVAAAKIGARGRA